MTCGVFTQQFVSSLQLQREPWKISDVEDLIPSRGQHDDMKQWMRYL